MFVQHLENCRLRGKGLAVMFLDLDHFQADQRFPSATTLATNC
ncbi:hypothetical protein ACPA9J_31680 [Pseudomonas aeruginosa]